MKNKKKILILGATGFIGRNLINLFVKKKNYRVFATFHKTKKINIKKLSWIKIDLTNPEEIKKLFKNKFDIVLQAAATTSGANVIVNSPQHHVTDNAIMNSLIMRACHEYKVKHVIFFSCTVMYPNSHTAQSENLNINTNKIFNKYYGVANTKLYIEKICEFYSNIGVTKFSCIRHSNIYGQYDKFDEQNSHFFGSTIRKVINLKDNETLSVWGKCNEKRDMLHIDDLLRFVEILINKQKKKFELINCSYGESFKIIDIIKMIIEISKKKLIIKHDLSKPSLGINILVKNKKAKMEYKWKPYIKIKNGIYKTLKWYGENKKN